MNLLIQPKKYKSLMADEGSKAIMTKTIAFFEKMGKPDFSTITTRRYGTANLSILSARSRSLPSCSPPSSMPAAIRMPAGTRRATANTQKFWHFTAWATGIASR
jgi:hypothetical protein